MTCPSPSPQEGTRAEHVAPGCTRSVLTHTPRPGAPSSERLVPGKSQLEGICRAHPRGARRGSHGAAGSRATCSGRPSESRRDTQAAQCRPPPKTATQAGAGPVAREGPGRTWTLPAAPATRRPQGAGLGGASCPCSPPGRLS